LGFLIKFLGNAVQGGADKAGVEAQGIVAGNAAFATGAAGEAMLDAMAAAVVRAVRAIKADTEGKRLQDEFFAGSAAPGVGPT